MMQGIWLLIPSEKRDRLGDWIDCFRIVTRQQSTAFPSEYIDSPTPSLGEGVAQHMSHKLALLSAYRWPNNGPIMAQ